MEKSWADEVTNIMPTLEARPRTNAEYTVAISQLFADMKHMAAKMAVTQRQIDKNRAETEAALTRLEATLQDLEQQRLNA